MKKSNLKQREFLQGLPTKRLLGYLGSLQKCHETPSLFTLEDELVKADPLWIENHLLVKEILMTRPNESKK